MIRTDDDTIVRRGQHAHRRARRPSSEAPEWADAPKRGVTQPVLTAEQQEERHRRELAHTSRVEEQDPLRRHPPKTRQAVCACQRPFRVSTRRVWTEAELARLRTACQEMPRITQVIRTLAAELNRSKRSVTRAITYYRLWPVKRRCSW